jgi:hypothetical protein
VLWHILCRTVSHFVPYCGTFCAFPWHISLKVFLCRAMVHFVPYCGTFCAFPWHISLNVFLCHAVAHFVPCRGTWYSVPSCQELQVKNCKSRIANQELQVKNCKSRIAKKVFKTVWTFFSRGLMNERIFSIVRKKVTILGYFCLTKCIFFVTYRNNYLNWQYSKKFFSSWFLTWRLCKIMTKKIFL